MWNYYDLIEVVNNLNSTVDKYGQLILYAVIFFGLLQFGRSFVKGGRSL